MVEMLVKGHAVSVPVFMYVVFGAMGIGGFATGMYLGAAVATSSLRKMIEKRRWRR